jgi:hypothetical protein
MASPNLAAVVLLSQFEEYATPNLIAPKGGVKGSFEAFEQGRCLAVTLPSYFIERLPKEKVSALRKIYSSPDMPNLALTVGPRISPQDRLAIAKALTGMRCPATSQPADGNHRRKRMWHAGAGADG